MSENTEANVNQKSSRRMTLTLIAVLVFGMGSLSYASVPLYKLFCQVTGYGGTTQVADTISTQVIDRDITVRFNANVDPSLDWHFAPVQNSLKLSIGENALAFYRVENRGSTPVVGTATFNVTPDKAGQYFNKVECFCFQEQLLEPNQQVDMPVSFFIDPELVNDPNLEDIKTITLSYTFFAVDKQSAAESVNKKKDES